MAQPPTTTTSVTTAPSQPPVTTQAGSSILSPDDVTMASLTQQLETMNATFEQFRNRQGLPPQNPGSLPTFSRLNGAGPRPHFLKSNKFSNLPGENFLAWRAQFQIIAEYNRWSQDEAKAVAFAHMTGLALESIMDINIKDPLQSLTQLLDAYQNRFLPRSESQMLRTQFN